MIYMERYKCKLYFGGRENYGDEIKDACMCENFFRGFRQMVSSPEGKKNPGRMIKNNRVVYK